MALAAGCCPTDDVTPLVVNVLDESGDPICIEGAVTASVDGAGTAEPLVFQPTMCIYEWRTPDVSVTLQASVPGYQTEQLQLFVPGGCIAFPTQHAFNLKRSANRAEEE